MLIEQQQQQLILKNQQPTCSRIISYEKESKEEKEEEEEENKWTMTLTNGCNCRFPRHRQLESGCKVDDTRSSSSETMMTMSSRQKEKDRTHCLCNAACCCRSLRIETQQQQQQTQTENDDLEKDSCPASNKNQNNKDEDRTRLSCTASVVRWSDASNSENNCSTTRNTMSTTRTIATTTTKRERSSCKSSNSNRYSSSSSLFRGMFKPLMVMMFLMMLSLGPVKADFHKALVRAITEEPPTNTFTNSSKRVCQSIDIRNKVSEFEKLKGCRVVEGFVQILLIDQADYSAYKDIVFPDLVEITGYLVLFRVPGLRSIGRLFPNLAVIRGNQILYNYALVAFEMNSLQEIGLHSLTDIVRGSVRIDKNPSLCFADTIDWDMIAKAGKGENVIGTNKPSNECPVCEKDCPERPTKPEDRLCWNKTKCQKVCNKCGDRACMSNGECCHASCLGGCNGPTEFNCTACRDVMVNDNQCVTSCPADMFTFLGRRCVTAQQCRMTRKPREMSHTIRTNPYKPFAGKCEIDCPPGHEEVQVNDEYSCKQCIGRCYKECAGAVVDNMNSAQRLRGCTFINGSLEIAIRDAQNVVKELEISLGQIEVITGYLRIFRNYPLVSLDFLKSLTEIQGNYLDMKEYSLVVLNNPNLQDLWNFNNRSKLRIYAKDKKDAKMRFHDNSKLCVQTIEQLREHTGLKPFSEIDVSTLSNGDRASCNMTTLKTEISDSTSKVAMIVWEEFPYHDARKLLGYTIYLKEAPAQNVSLYEARNACGGDGWRVQDYIPADEQAPNIGPPNSLDGSITDFGSTIYNTEKNSTKMLKTLLYELKPYTQYAYYVKTYMISGERTGAQSPIQYFTTLPGQPSSVRALAVYASGSDTLVIEWLPPTEPNSVLTHYKIVGTLETYDAELFRLRDYCEEPIIPEYKSPQVIAAEGKEKAEKELEASKQPEPSPCSCAKPAPVKSENDVYHSIAFEDALHNQVYVKRSNSRRKRGSTNISSIMLDTVRMKREFNSLQEKDVINHNKKTGDLETKKRDRVDLSKKTEDSLRNNSKRFEIKVPANQTRLVIPNLRNYGKYNIAVMACREYTANKLEKDCSPEAIKSYQTLRKEHADDIPKDSFKISTSTDNSSTPIIKLTWQEPPHPNGIIVSYHIEYKRVDVSGHKQDTLCLTGENFIKNGYVFTMPDLGPGNYSVRVLAISLAGYGAHTPTLFFDIPELNVSMPLWKVVTIIVICVGLISGVITGGVYYHHRKERQRVPQVRLIATVNPEYVATDEPPPIKIDDGWELPRSNIEIIKELGAGSFGMVYEGIYRDPLRKIEMRIAIKTVSDNPSERQRHEFLKEAHVMKAFQSYHIVKLLGVVTATNPTLVVMELMLRGDLKRYLRTHRPDEYGDELPPTEERIFQMAIEIADGMAYLASRKYVHRDLAARNIMVAEDLTVKIGDFGMTRDIYETDYYRKGTKGLLPVRWMPPEALKDGVFTSASDVWSFGVVLWEMITFCAQPYPGLANDQVLRYVSEGGIMERPDECKLDMYELMVSCWKFKPLERVTFSEIIEIFLPRINSEHFRAVSYYFNPDRFRNPPTKSELNASLPNLTKGTEEELIEKIETHSEAPEDASENSPLRQDFHQDFSSAFDPLNNGNAAAGVMLMPMKDNRYKLEPSSKIISSSPRTPLGFMDLDSSKTPLKAGFDDFDGVSSAAASLASSKDTLNLPFVEENVGSVKSSPYNRQKSSSRGNISQRSASRTSLSPQSPSIMVGSSSPGNRPSPSLVASSRSDLDSDNRSPVFETSSPAGSAHFHGSRASLRIGAGSNNASSFPSMDAIDSIDATGNRRRGLSSSPLAAVTTSAMSTPPLAATDSIQLQQRDGKQQSEQDQQQQQSVPPTSLNNGYISSGPAT